MKTQRLLLLGALIALLVTGATATGQVLDYAFRVGTGANINMAGAAVVYNGTAGGPYANRVTSGLPIGFTFNFNGVNYTFFSLSTNGVMALGSTITTSSTNSLTTSGAFPRISPWWDIIQVGTGQKGCGQPQISYMTIGSAPYRTLVIEYRQVDLLRNSPRWGTFQVRLYETLNSVEFYYAKMSPCDVCNQGFACANTSASIGIAASTSRYMSVTPNALGASYSTTSVNNNVNLQTTPIADNTTYTFTQCGLQLSGLTGAGNGGTVLLNNGDTFFSGSNTPLGGVQVFHPFTARMADQLCNGSYTMTIGGAAASDYYFGSPGAATRTLSLNGGVLDTATITFGPTATGLRSATLTVTSGTFSRVFNLGAYSPNVNYTGDIPQGGTLAMASGDTLLNGMLVPRHGTQSFTPFTLTNVGAASRTITYTLSDPTGQYAITPGGALGAGESTSPVITFTANGFGPQAASLTVDAGGSEVRSFMLRAISAAPGAEMRADATLLDSNATLFTNLYACVGDQPVSVPITIKSIGYADYLLTGAEFYTIDTSYGQGRPRYPFLRDGNEALFPSIDYALTTVPNVIPDESNRVTFPLVVPQNGSQTIYLTFTAQRPEKRFARVYFRSNGQSIASPDTMGTPVDGMVSFGVFGRGSGPVLAGSADGSLPKPLLFGETQVRTSTDTPLVIVNPGLCPLRVSLSSLEIFEGDVDEFSIVKVPTRNVEKVTGDLVIAPGGSDTIWARFHPRQQGSRRAAMRIATNDSTVLIPGLTERGTYYLDLFGNGKADVYAEDIDFGTALIGGTGPDQVHRMVGLKNTLNRPIVIAAIAFEGADSAEFTQDAGNPWPAFPVEIKGGQEGYFGMVFAPVAGGAPGPRGAVMKMITSSGDTIYARLKGTAGTRTLVVTPATVNFGAVTAGKQVRQTIMIGNTGTMPLTLGAPVLSAGSDFSFGSLPRLTLEPGQKEYLELTYSPQLPGGSNATLTIGSNAVGPAMQVMLNGAATKARWVENDPSQTVTGGRHGRRGYRGGQVSAGSTAMASGVESQESIDGMTLWQSVPNPGRDQVEIRYSLPGTAEIRLELYDAAGRLLRLLDAGTRGAGETRLVVDVRGLPNGTYHYRLSAGDRTLGQTMTIAR